MFHLSIDTIIFAVFLLANVVIGLLASRRVKTLREYAIGNKDFSTGTLTSTIVATWFGGGFMFYALKNIYTSGLQFIIPSMASAICLLFMGQVLAVRMGEFLNNLSVAEAMKKLFDTRIQVVTAISGALRGIGIVAIQFQVMAKMLTFLFEIEGSMATILAATIVIIYSAFGGVRSVTITDVFQFIAFGIFIPILALVVWKQIKDPKKVVDVLTTNPIFSFKNVVGWDIKTLSVLTLMLFWAIPGFSPAIFQRISMAKDLIQVKKSFTYAGWFDFLISMSIAWLAVLLLSDNPNADPTNLVNHIITSYAYPGLTGLIALGIASMAMSTADSELNAATVLVVNDFIKPLKKAKKENEDIPESLSTTRLWSLILGIGGLILALHTTDFLKLLLLSGSFWMPVVTVPFLLAIFGFRSSSRAVLIGMAAGIAVVCVGKSWNPYDIDPLIPGMLANLVFYMGSHYILREKGGWVGIQDKSALIAARQDRQEAWVRLMNAIKHPRIYFNLQKNTPSDKLIYTLFGIYLIGATYASFYTITSDIIKDYAQLYNVVSYSVITLAAIFITYPGWPPTIKKLQPIITIVWPVGMGYVLFVVGTILVMMSGFNEIQGMVFLLNILMAAFLLSWPLMLVLLAGGIMLGYGIFSYYCDYMQIPYVATALPAQFKIIYGILLFSSFLIVLFKFKRKQAVLEEENQYLITLQEQNTQELSEALGYREEVLKELDEEDMKSIDETVAAYIRHIIYRAVDYLRLEVTQVKLDTLMADVKHLLSFDPNHPHLAIHNHTQIDTISADGEQLKQMFIRTINYIHQYDPANQTINITLEKAMLGHRVGQIADYTRRLYAVKITVTTEETPPPTQEIYMIDQVNLISKANEQKDRKVLLANARIVDAHYGYAEFESQTHLYVLPVDVREVRGKVMELLREPAGPDLTEVNHPLAIQLEQELLAKVKSIPSINVQVIKKALDTIKKYHAGTKRKSGEPFFTHPINVALILLDYSQDQDAIVAALLHDTVEDTSLTLSQVRTKFGETVAMMVEKLTNLEDDPRKKSLNNHEYVTRLLSTEDRRISEAKLADRTHNMRTIQGHPSLKKQQAIADETLNLFVPMAERLGLMEIADELRKISLEVLSKKE